MCAEAADLWNAPYWLSGGVDKKGQAVLLRRARSNCSSCSPCPSKLLSKSAVHVSDVLSYENGLLIKTRMLKSNSSNISSGRGGGRVADLFEPSSERIRC